MARAGRSGPLLSYVHTALFLGKDLSNWLRLCPSFSMGLKIFTYLINLLFLTALGPRCYPGFSLVVVSGGLSSWNAQASHCGGFSCCGAQVQEHVDSVVGTRRL